MTYKIRFASLALGIDPATVKPNPQLWAAWSRAMDSMTGQSFLANSVSVACSASVGKQQTGPTTLTEAMNWAFLEVTNAVSDLNGDPDISSYQSGDGGHSGRAALSYKHDALCTQFSTNQVCGYVVIDLMDLSTSPIEYESGTHGGKAG